MARRVFLDVGGHNGETLREVVKPRWRFDRIWSFEPASRCLAALRAHVDERVEVVHGGWWTADATMDLHDPGEIGASVAPAKSVTDATERCPFIDAARWMSAHIEQDDIVWMKLNCEGSECDVLDRLLDAGELTKVTHLLVHFDAEKIPGMEHRAHEVRARLRAAGVGFVEAREIMYGRSREAKTANWLAWSEATRLRRLQLQSGHRLVHGARRRVFRIRRRLGWV